MSDTNSFVSKEFELLISAYTLANNSANRAWLVGTTLTIIAIGASTGTGSLPKTDVELSGPNFFLATTLALVGANFRLCSVYLSALETQKIFHKYLADIPSKYVKFSPSLTLDEVAHRVTSSSYNRLYIALLFFKNKETRDAVMKYAKPAFDLFYLAIPFLGMLVAIWRSFTASSAEETTNVICFLLAIATLSVALQCVFSGLTIYSAMGRHNEIKQIDKSQSQAPLQSGD